MTVYADVLMLVNFVVDYFLLALTCRFLRLKPPLVRLLLSSAVGGVCSLYIFLPQTSFILNCLAHSFMCAVICLVAFGFENIKKFLRCAATLFCVNFAYSGAMIALWLVLKPKGMVINNSVVYFNISPLFLLLFSVLGYFIVILIRKIVKPPFLPNSKCQVSIWCGEKHLELSGIVDTGNSLEDVFGLSEIFITEACFADAILGEQKQNPARQRKIPCATVVGESLLDGYRIDKAEVVFNNKKHIFKNPILAVSGTAIAEAQIIVNPENLN